MRKGVPDMLMDLFVVWLLISVFIGSYEANRFFRIAFGFLAGMWILRLVLSFGIRLLPLIILAALFSYVIMPFVKGFMSRFRGWKK